MDLQLKDKIIIVTGGAKGIGEGIVKDIGEGRSFSGDHWQKPGR